MEKSFWAGLCYNGTHSGGLYLMDDYMAYRTAKNQLPDEMKSIDMSYRDIESVHLCSWHLLFRAIEVNLKNGLKYKFIVFFLYDFINTIDDRVKFS